MTLPGWVGQVGRAFLEIGRTVRRQWLAVLLLGPLAVGASSILQVLVVA